MMMRFLEGSVGTRPVNLKEDELWSPVVEEMSKGIQVTFLAGVDEEEAVGNGATDVGQETEFGSPNATEKTREPTGIHEEGNESL